MYLITNYSSTSRAIGPWMRSRILTLQTKAEDSSIVLPNSTSAWQTCCKCQILAHGEWIFRAGLPCFMPAARPHRVYNDAVTYHDTQHLIALSWEDITSVTASDLCANWCISWKLHGFQDTRHHITNDGLNCCILAISGIPECSLRCHPLWWPYGNSLSLHVPVLQNSLRCLGNGVLGPLLCSGLAGIIETTFSRRTCDQCATCNSDTFPQAAPYCQYHHW